MKIKIDHARIDEGFVAKSLADAVPQKQRDEVQLLFPARLLHSGGVPQSVAANMCDARVFHLCYPKLTTTFAFLLFCFFVFAQKPTVMRDLTEPESKKEDALCGQLRMATLCTNDLGAIKKFYVDGMGMTLSPALAMNNAQKQMAKALWGIPNKIDFTVYKLYRKEVPENILIRVLLIKQKMPAIHESYSSREQGPFSLGFPNNMQRQLDVSLRKHGVESMAPLQASKIYRADSSFYNYLETIYKAPDNVHAVGITREGIAQLAPYDTATGLGGPGYSAQVVTGMSDTIISFFKNVLGYEVRRDNLWTSGKGSALGIEAGVPFRFTALYAKGATNGHVLLMDFKDKQSIELKMPPRLPYRGLGMYTMETKDLQKVYANALAFHATGLQKPSIYNDAILGKIKLICMQMPNGFLVEVFERVD